MLLKAQITVMARGLYRAAGVAVAYGEGYGHCICYIVVSVPGKWVKRFICSKQLPQSFPGVGSGVM